MQFDQGSSDAGSKNISSIPLRSLLLPLILCLFFTTDIRALESVKQAGIVFTYEKDCEDIVSRMMQQAPMIRTFLRDRGIVSDRLIHVVLDDMMDTPDVVVHMIPHSEIRIPVRAPGVTEEGYLQKDPWSYFLFKGMCLHGIYSMRSKIPGIAHKAFGELVSPNVITPQWLTDGTCALLFSLYSGTPLRDPFYQAISSMYIPQDLAQVSNHPGIWPGHFSYRTYGRPFMVWLYQHYGWEKIYNFLTIHGGGIIPIEIDLKAKQSFGKTWASLWNEFRQSCPPDAGDETGMLITGYNPDPFVFWNASGIYPGMKRVRQRSRYGFVDNTDRVWISEYGIDGISRITAYSTKMTAELDVLHVWDPGRGGIAVTRKGPKSYLVFLDVQNGLFKQKAGIRKMIPAPDGTLQISGPALNSKGQIAVAANTGGNWDIWVYDSSWHRITSAGSIEMDPYWDGDSLVFSSNITGSFQIHRSDLSQVSTCRYAGVMPKDGTFLCLKSHGWQVAHYEKETDAENMSPEFTPLTSSLSNKPVLDATPYSPLKSVLPNFIAPDIFVGTSDTQLGLVTWARDVTGDYTANAGFRYSFDLDYLSARAAARIKDIGAGISRYPVSYDPENAIKTEESRNELRLFLRPRKLSWLELSLHRQCYEPLKHSGTEDTEFWGALAMNRRFKYVSTSVTAESYSGGMTSVFGHLRFLFGSEIYSTFLVQAGRTWGKTTPGHGTYRVGGNTGEGYFSQRPTRLFALRGFSPNILEAGKAVTSSFEVYWPLANIQQGYKTLPLFFHRLHLGTFIDAGACSDTVSFDERLIGAGIELITSMEVAWGNLSSFRIGIAWPVSQPDCLDEDGPVFVLQVGRPL